MANPATIPAISIVHANNLTEVLPCPSLPLNTWKRLPTTFTWAKGTPPEEAEIVAAHQVKANLVGHDSHGVIHVPEYCERIDRGHIVPGAPL